MGVSSAFAQIPSADLGNYYYIGDVNYTFLNGFSNQFKSGTQTVYFNGSKAGELKGPFKKDGTSINATYIGGKNTGTGFTYENGKGMIANCINAATINYTEEGGTVTISVANNLTLEINGVTPFVSPIEVEIPNNISVFEYDSYSNETLIVKNYEGTTILANTPVILKPESAGEFTFNFVGENNELSYDTEEASGHTYIKDNVVGVLHGVQTPHQVAEKTGYYFNGEKFIPATDKYTIILPFTCFIDLSGEDSDLPADISIVFPEEEEQDVLYIHFTDEEGNYDYTHSDVLTKNSDGNYVLELIKLEDTTYYVLSKSNFESNSEIAVASYNSWADFNGTIYHNNGMEEINPAVAESITPFSSESGNYTFTVTTGENGEPSELTVSTNISEGVGAITLEKNNVIYNIFGQKVDESYRGIVIKNGKKYIQR